MSGKLLEKYTGRTTEGIQGDSEDETEDLGAFGWLRSAQDRCAMIELRKKDGNIIAIPYGWIERLEFDPSEGITLHIHGKQIRVRGRNLNTEVRPNMRLFQGLARHRVSWIQEAEQSRALVVEKHVPVVTSIES